jgi:hypothetical protein
LLRDALAPNFFFFSQEIIQQLLLLICAEFFELRACYSPTGVVHIFKLVLWHVFQYNHGGTTEKIDRRFLRHGWEACTTPATIFCPHPLLEREKYAGLQSNGLSKV